MNSVRITGLLSFCVLLTVTAVPGSPSQANAPTLKKVAEFDLPGPHGKRFDYLTIDEDDHYLISAHLAADQTYVIDLATNRVVATVTDTPGAEGVEYVPELKKFYTSNAHDNTIAVVDLKQMQVIKKLKTEAKPDGSAYAAPFHKLYVSDERGKAEAIVGNVQFVKGSGVRTPVRLRFCFQFLDDLHLLQVHYGNRVVMGVRGIELLQFRNVLDAFGTGRIRNGCDHSVGTQVTHVCPVDRA